MAAAFVSAAVFCAVAMAAAWAVQRVTGKSGWIDTIWSFSTGIAAIGLVLALAPPVAVASPSSLVLALLGLWSLRLGIHLARRTAGGGDDPRYAELMRGWGASGPWKLFGFLQVQALAAWLLAVAVVSSVVDRSTTLDALDILGGLLALAAILGETIADAQLDRFRADPANRSRVCDIGLWGLSRHPNYFFEWLGWCAYPLIAAAGIIAHPVALLSLIAPAMMYYLLVHASGIPHLEAHMARSRGAAFDAYKARVPAFWPRWSGR